MNAEQRTSGRQPSDQATWLGLPVGNYRLQPPSPFIIITQPESWYSFTVPRRVEGWVDLGIAGKVHTARAQGCKSQWLCDKHNCPQRDLIPGLRALQSDMLLLDHCDLLCFPVYPRTYIHTHILIIISAPPYYIVSADNCVVKRQYVESCCMLQLNCISLTRWSHWFSSRYQNMHLFYTSLCQ